MSNRMRNRRGRPYARGNFRDRSASDHQRYGRSRSRNNLQQQDIIERILSRLNALENRSVSVTRLVSSRSTNRRQPHRSASSSSPGASSHVAASTYRRRSRVRFASSRDRDRPGRPIKGSRDGLREPSRFARLVDAQSGADVWSERFDRSGADPWALQDEIAGRIVEQGNDCWPPDRASGSRCMTTGMRQLGNAPPHMGDNCCMHPDRHAQGQQVILNIALCRPRDDHRAKQADRQEKQNAGQESRVVFALQ